MYTREILPPRSSPIENGNPLLGTWTKAFDSVDLLEIRKPYQFPLPRWIRASRIKEWECFSAQDDHFMLEAFLCNFKLYRMAQVLLYDKDNGQKIIFRKTIPGMGWKLPVSLANSSFDSHSKDFYFCIHTWLDADTVKLDLNMEKTRRNPSLTVHLAYNIDSQEVTPVTVSLGLADRRIMYAYKVLSPVRGDMVFDGRHIILKQEACSGFFCDYKGFFPYGMQEIMCSAMGFDEKNQRYGFHIAENQCRDTYKNNENALWVNGRLTPLPPVLVTMPKGPDSDWIIQDVEGMVDLTFTPDERRAAFIFTNVELNVPLGYYNGMLVNADGGQIAVKNLFGMGEKLNLRV
jgi:hypothetical protein